MHAAAQRAVSPKFRVPAPAARPASRGRLALKPRPAAPHPWITQIDRLQNGFQLNQIQLAAQLLNCAPRSLILWKKGRTPNPAVLIRLHELNRLYLALTDLMPSEDVGPWMKQTNDYLDPLTPLEVINRGQLDRLWQIIHHVGAGLPT